MITLRPLTIWDSAFCYRLACDADARANSFDPRRPSWWRQPLRMWRNLRDPDRKDWVILIDEDMRRRHGVQEMRVGVIGAQPRIGKEPLLATTVSINIAREWRGRSIGPRAIRALLDMAARREFGYWGTLIAEIKPDNQASIRAFTKAGFHVLQTTADKVTMRYVREAHANR